MARVMFAVFAQRVSIDRFSNTLDIHSVLEQLMLPAPDPERLVAALKKGKGLRAPVSIQLIVHWRRSDPSKPEGTANSRVVLVGPNGRELGISEQTVNVRATEYMRGLINYNELVIVGEGIYTAKILLRSGSTWRKVGEASFSVKFAPKTLGVTQAPKRLQ